MLLWYGNDGWLESVEGETEDVGEVDVELGMPLDVGWMYDFVMRP